MNRILEEARELVLNSTTTAERLEAIKRVEVLHLLKGYNAGVHRALDLDISEILDTAPEHLDIDLTDSLILNFFEGHR